ncbi:MAG: GDP-mannose 4,6-dehydratase, partial [Nitrosospira sp.]|nr:GDP-mannose 4,6-dehydratase [Nitrosospira sp.]
MAKMKKALICGISGQDGSYLARLLLSRGYEVWGSSRDAQSCAPENLARLGVQQRVQLVSMVPNDFKSTLAAVAQCAPDEIYYLSGPSSVALSFKQPAQTQETN